MEIAANRFRSCRRRDSSCKSRIVVALRNRMPFRRFRREFLEKYTYPKTRNTPFPPLNTLISRHRLTPMSRSGPPPRWFEKLRNPKVPTSAGPGEGPPRRRLRTQSPPFTDVSLPPGATAYCGYDRTPIAAPEPCAVHIPGRCCLVPNGRRRAEGSWRNSRTRIVSRFLPFAIPFVKMGT